MCRNVWAPISSSTSYKLFGDLVFAYYLLELLVEYPILLLNNLAVIILQKITCVPTTVIHGK